MVTDRRKSYTALNKIYFWTATIYKWIPLLDSDCNKQIIIDSFKYLSDKELKANGNSKYYEVNEVNKKHEIWQRDSLGVEIYNREVAQQKLDYIHFNPVTGKWKLAKDDLDYHFSSAKFYETGVDNFGFLNNIYRIFDGD